MSLAGVGTGTLLGENGQGGQLLRVEPDPEDLRTPRQQSASHDSDPRGSGPPAREGTPSSPRPGNDSRT